MGCLPSKLPEGLELRQTEAGLALVGEGMVLCPDFCDMLSRLRGDRLGRELLVRAARLRGVEGHPRCVDATAGLGEDALLLAASGFEVLLCEANAVICALLQDALFRAAKVPELTQAVSRMHLYEGDSVKCLEQLEVPPSVVYLDPMFPQRSKHAAVKKKFQLLQRLERPCADNAAERLLHAALAAHPRKVVVKRPIKGPNLASVKPSYALRGKAVRYDVIVPSASQRACCLQSAGGQN